MSRDCRLKHAHVEALYTHDRVLEVSHLPLLRILAMFHSDPEFFWGSTVFIAVHRANIDPRGVVKPDVWINGRRTQRAVGH
jgi:hypothetical protein